jgi:hypothetical protein
MKLRYGYVALLFLGVFNPLNAFSQTEIVRIEEDWELTVSAPDVRLDAPQVTVAMAPFVSTPSLHLQVNFNYALKPDFASGGIQLRVEYEDQVLAHLHRKAGVQLSHSAEVIAWTSVVQKTESGYAFGIHSGNGASWGSFGGDNYLLYLSSSIASGGLQGYSPTNSVENSGTTYAGNRVQSLRLKQFRVFDSLGQVAEYQVNLQVQ